MYFRTYSTTHMEKIKQVSCLVFYKLESEIYYILKNRQGERKFVTVEKAVELLNCRERNSKIYKYNVIAFVNNGYINLYIRNKGFLNYIGRILEEKRLTER